MTATEKLIKKEFKIKTEAALIELLSSKPSSFYRDNFFTDKAQYLKNIQELISSINSLGEVYSMAMAEMKPSNVMRSLASQTISEMKGEYQQKRKALKNHIQLFIKK